MTEPTERSMPPVMITTVMPSAMIPKGAKLRTTFPILLAVPKVGSEDTMTTISANSATVTQNGWLATRRLRIVSSSTPKTSETEAWVGFDGGRLLVQAGTNGSVINPGDLFRRGSCRVLVGDLAAAPQHDDASQTANTSGMRWLISMTDTPCDFMLRMSPNTSATCRPRSPRSVRPSAPASPWRSRVPRDRRPPAAGRPTSSSPDRAAGFPTSAPGTARRAVDHRLLVEHAKGPEAFLDLATQKHVLRRGQIVGERQVLIDDLDALGPRIDRLVESAHLAFDGDLALGRRKLPAMILTIVDLPAPLSPISPTTSPGSTEKLSSVSAWIAPKCIEMLRMSSNATPVLPVRSRL
jgi:hypothetical protein